MDDLLERLGRGAWLDPDTGRQPDMALPVMAVERSLRGLEASLVRPFGFGRRLAVVTDPTTRAVLGARVETALRDIATPDPVVLPDRPHADMATVAVLRQATSRADALVAVGSGTINDLCKYVAAQAAKPYVVFATAASMNGYTSMNAAITVDGHKKSLSAAAPRAVFVDLEVLAGAPPRMIRAGIGDSLCRSTAQADWRLSHRLRGTPYKTAPFRLLAEHESVLIDHSDALVAGDIEAMRHLARTLLLSGIGMTICHGSYPASQGEHLISHFIDMFEPPGRAPYFHGEQVGVATLTMARMQERLLGSERPPRMKPSAANRESLHAELGSDAAEPCWREFERKKLDRTRAEEFNAVLEGSWSAIRADIASLMVSAHRLDDALRRAGAPRGPQEIGLDAAFYRRAVAHARYLRDRYTFRDFAADSEQLTETAAA